MMSLQREWDGTSYLNKHGGAYFIRGVEPKLLETKTELRTNNHQLVDEIRERDRWLNSELFSL